MSNVAHCARPRLSKNGRWLCHRPPQHPDFHSQFFRMHTVHGMYVCAVLYARSTKFFFLRFPLLSWNEMLLFPVLWISLLARLLPLACPLSSHKLRNGHC